MIEEFAPAKVNLTLHVGPARADGYHPVDSLVVFADRGDRLSVSPASDFKLAIEGEGAETLNAEADNLVLKAAHLLHEVGGLSASTGAHIHLNKTIPLGSGLGGGSANAAAALRALNTLWSLDWPVEKLADLGAQIGSDVPACVWSKPLHMTGRGEQVTLFTEWPELCGVLCLPGSSVSTARIFSAYDANLPDALRLSAVTPTHDVEAALAMVNAGTNDLETVAIQQAPVIGHAITALRGEHRPAFVRMSGSGSTVFAIHNAYETAELATRALTQTYPDWRFVPVRLGGT